MVLRYKGQDAVMFNEKMMRLARLRYVVTSHDPFDAAQLLLCLRPPVEMPRYKSALALDALLEGQWERVISSLEATQRPRTLRPVAQSRSELLLCDVGGVYELVAECVKASCEPVWS